MEKVAIYKDLIIEEAVNKIAKEKKEKKEERPNIFNAGGMIHEESKKTYSTKDKLKNMALATGAGMVGTKAGERVGQKIGVKMLQKGKSGPAAQLAIGLTAGLAGNAAQAPFIIKSVKKNKEARKTAVNTLANKYYADDAEAKRAATKKPNMLVGDVGRLANAERIYKKNKKKK